MKYLLVTLTILLICDIIITKYELNKLELVVISCLNHGGVYIDENLHLCRPANTHIKKEKNEQTDSVPTQTK